MGYAKKDKCKMISIVIYTDGVKPGKTILIVILTVKAIHGKIIVIVIFSQFLVILTFTDGAMHDKVFSCNPYSLG